jgi:hypothetical protein
MLYSTCIVAGPLALPSLTNGGRKRRKRHPDNCCPESLPASPDSVVQMDRDGRRICCSARAHFRNGVLSSCLPPSPLLWQIQILICGAGGTVGVTLAVHWQVEVGRGQKLKLKLCHQSDVLYPESKLLVVRGYGRVLDVVSTMMCS